MAPLLSQDRKPLSYRDFNLRFASYEETNGIGTFKVWVEGQAPGGTMKPDDANQCIYNPKDFWNDPTQGIGGRLGDLERRRIKREELILLGKLLSDLALPTGPIRSLFEKSLDRVRESGEGLRLRLQIDPVSLRQLPWEFMLLSQVSGEPKDTDFLALCRDISIVRTDTVETAQRSLPDRETIQVVGVLSNPDGTDELNLDKDKDAIEKAIAALNSGGKEYITSKWADRPATRKSLQDVLSKDVDIFHYAGHALFDRLAQEGKLVLEKEDHSADAYSSEQFAQLLQGKARLVVLGACQTGRRDGQNIWSGIAPALTRHKIPAVIANQFAINDQSAIYFASEAYQLILAGYTVDEAVFAARLRIYQQLGLEQRDWGTPVLYLQDASGVLFPIPDTNTPTGGSKSPLLKIIQNNQRIAGSKVVGLEAKKISSGRNISVEQNNEVIEGGAEVIAGKFEEV